MTGDRQLGSEAPLKGLRILIVEDEMMVAMALEDMLAELGCDVVKAARVAKALQIAATMALDGAILDVNIAGEGVYPVADELRRRGIPFIFSSGYGPGGLALEYAGQPTLSKPFRDYELGPMLAGAIYGSDRQSPLRR